jgi:hypothetical protein
MKKVKKITLINITSAVFINAIFVSSSHGMDTDKPDSQTTERGQLEQKVLEFIKQNDVGISILMLDAGLDKKSQHIQHILSFTDKFGKIPENDKEFKSWYPSFRNFFQNRPFNKPINLDNCLDIKAIRYIFSINNVGFEYHDTLPLLSIVPTSYKTFTDDSIRYHYFPSSLLLIKHSQTILLEKLKSFSQKMLKNCILGVHKVIL